MLSFWRKAAAWRVLVGALALVVAMQVVAVLATACTGGEPTPVPREAGAPFVCDGVPSRGVELALGGAAVAERTGGSWAEGERFSCAVTREQGPGTIMVTSMPVSQAGTWGGDEDAVVATLADQGDAEPIEADARGSGFVYADGSAGWVCDGRFTLVILDDVATKGRDPRADAAALAVSMLPWACGDISAPARTVED